jgi:DNA-binding FrmR family transcriptional regulator
MNKDEKCRAAVAARLSRVEGQVRRVQKMVDEGHDCVAVVRQLAVIDGNVRATARMIVARHLESCLGEPLKTEQDRQHVMQELSDIFGRFS